MENEKLLEISNDPSLKSNKDLEEGLELLNDEFEKTKFAIVELTRHLDTVEKNCFSSFNSICNLFYTLLTLHSHWILLHHHRILH